MTTSAVNNIAFLYGVCIVLLQQICHQSYLSLQHLNFLSPWLSPNLPQPPSLSLRTYCGVTLTKSVSYFSRRAIRICMQGKSPAFLSPYFDKLISYTVTMDRDAEGFVSIWDLRSYRPLYFWKAHKAGLLTLKEFDGGIITYVYLSLLYRPEQL